jgi:hypothetical protein
MSRKSISTNRNKLVIAKEWEGGKWQSLLNGRGFFGVIKMFSN